MEQILTKLKNLIHQPSAKTIIKTKLDIL